MFISLFDKDAMINRDAIKRLYLDNDGNICADTALKQDVKEYINHNSADVSIFCSTHLIHCTRQYQNKTISRLFLAAVIYSNVPYLILNVNSVTKCMHKLFRNHPETALFKSLEDYANWLDVKIAHKDIPDTEWLGYFHEEITKGES